METIPIRRQGVPILCRCPISWLTSRLTRTYGAQLSRVEKKPLVTGPCAYLPIHSWSSRLPGAQVCLELVALQGFIRIFIIDSSYQTLLFCLATRMAGCNPDNFLWLKLLDIAKYETLSRLHWFQRSLVIPIIFHCYHYPLVNVYITLENHHAINGKITTISMASMAMFTVQ